MIRLSPGPFAPTRTSSVLGRSISVTTWMTALTVTLGSTPLLGQGSRIPDNPQLRWEYFYRQRAYPFDRIPAGALQSAHSVYAARWPRSTSAPPPVTGNSWQPLGPERIPVFATSTGRLSAIAVHPTDSDIIYVGGAQGGVWRTTNGGASWTPLTDNECSLAMGSIAIDPVDPNIVYAGTGEQHFSADSYYGCGVLRSDDGGTSWAQLGASVFTVAGQSNARISRVVVDPSTAGSTTGTTVLAASTFGLYRSTNSGGSWTEVLAGTVTDLVINPLNASVYYAAVYGSSVFKSVDGGISWSPVSTGFPASNVGRINIGIAASDTNTVFAGVHNNATSDLLGIYRTQNGGGDWAAVNALGASCGFQCWYNMFVFVDPTDVNVVYFGGVSLYRSDDGGSNFSNITGSIHVDQHFLAFDPQNSSVVFVGNDGGVFRSPDRGATWTTLNTNLELTQFYAGVSLHPTNPDVALGGTQDNGTIEYAGSPDWNFVLGGDGGFTAIDYIDPSTRYAETQWGVGFGGPRRSDNGGSFFRRVNGITDTEAALFIPPMVMDPTNPEKLYFGTYRVYRTTNRADSWSPISSDLSAGFGVVSAIAPSKADSQTVYVGTSDAQLQVTEDDGATWSLRTTGLPNRYITDIAVDDDDALTAYVAYSGYGGGHVFRTTDAGNNWQNASGNLPDIPVNAILLDPGDDNTVFIGTDLGMFVTTNGGTTWTPFNTGLPNVAIFDLVYNPTTGILVAATHGRGLFSLEMATPIFVETSIASVSDTANTGDTDIRAASATVQVGGTGSNTTAWTATHGAASWITLTTASGVGIGNVEWTRDPTGLGAGTFVDTITVDVPGAVGSPIAIIDTLVMLPVVTLAVTPPSRSDTAVVGSTTPIGESATVTLSGPDANLVGWTATHGGGGWLTVTQGSGTGSGTVQWSRDPTGLASGVYIDTITVSALAVGSPAQVVDTLVVITTLALSVDPTSRSDSAAQGSTATLDDSATVTITGVNPDAATWTATHGAGSWLSVVTADGTGSGTVSWTRDPNGLDVGIYVDTVTVTVANAEGSPAEIIDTLLIRPPLTLAVSPASRSLTVIEDQAQPTPDSATVALTGLASASTDWTATHGSATWLVLTTADGTGSGTVRWTRVSSGINPGVYVDTVTVVAAGAAGSPALVIDTLEVLQPLTLTVADASRSDSAIVGDTTITTDSATVQLTGTGGQTATWVALSRLGTWVTVTSGTGTGTGTLRWNRNPRGLPEGTFVDTITVTTAGAVGSPVQIVDTLRILPPPITVDEAAAALLAQQAVTAEQLDYLDARGNNDGVYNLGDLLAYLTRVGTVSAISDGGPGGIEITPTKTGPRTDSPNVLKPGGADATH